MISLSNSELTLLSLVALLSASCSGVTALTDEETAEALAIEKILDLSGRMKNHVYLDRTHLRVTKVVYEDNGWYVSVNQDQCNYIVYVRSKGDIDVAGSSAGCISP